MAIPEIYLDTNAISDLFRKGSDAEAEIRERLRGVGAASKVIPLTSGATIEEIGGIAADNWSKYERMVAFAFEVVEDRFIADSATLIERELIVGRRLRGRERFFDSDDVRQLRNVTADPERVREASAEWRARAAGSAETWRATREHAWAAVTPLTPDGDPRKAVRDWWAAAPRWIEQWARDNLPNRMRLAGFDPTAAKMYPLHLVPTLTNVVGEVMARVAWNAGHGRTIRDSDDADTHHYAAACYAAIFVSGDDALRQIIGLIPQPCTTPITVAALVDKYLVDRASIACAP